MTLTEACEWVEEVNNVHLSELGFYLTKVKFYMDNCKCTHVKFANESYEVKVEAGDFLQLRYKLLDDPDSPLNF